MMDVLVGSTEDRQHLQLMKRHGWGRMWLPDRQPKPYDGEPWGYDNGAFVCWKRGIEWNEVAWLRRIERIEDAGLAPMLAVLPDIVADGERSLELSLSWLYSDRLPDWPWYLAVQDGMEPDDVLPALDHVAGIFLGGSDDFKLTAPLWAELAHACGCRFHYARAGTMRKLRHAKLSGADSIDSAFPTWTRPRMRQFLRWWSDCEAQLLIRDMEGVSE